MGKVVVIDIAETLPLATYKDEYIVTWWQKHGSINITLYEKIKLKKYGTNEQRAKLHTGRLD